MLDSEAGNICVLTQIFSQQNLQIIKGDDYTCKGAKAIVCLVSVTLLKDESFILSLRQAKVRCVFRNLSKYL